MIDLLPFGRTGHESTRLIFGAAALGGMSQARADSTMEIVRAAGINHIDTAASYGQSEVRLQPFLAARLPLRRGGPARRVRQPLGGRADDQGGRPPAVARRRQRPAVQLVPAAA